MSGSLQEDLLLAGIDDWVHFAEVARLAAQREVQGSLEDQIAVALAALRDLQDRGLVEIGDVGPDGFTAWQLPHDEAAERVGGAWQALGHNPLPGDIGWLANTELGDRVARESRGQER